MQPKLYQCAADMITRSLLPSLFQGNHPKGFAQFSTIHQILFHRALQACRLRILCNIAIGLIPDETDCSVGMIVVRMYDVEHLLKL